MPCENCAAQFTVFKRKRTCCECDRYYCGNCLGKNSSNSSVAGLCGACRILCNRQIDRRALDHLRVRDLQCFLHRQNISTRGCIEKEELITLVVAHVNSGNFKRRNPQSNNDFLNSFPSIRGFTSNLNNVISSAFDLASSNGRSQQKTRSGASNRSHPTSPNSSVYNNPTTSNNVPNVSQNQNDRVRQSNLFTLNGERPPILIPPEAENIPPDDENSLEPTTDCLEVEDIEDSAEWEFVRRPADPLPQDSDELLTEEVETTQSVEIPITITADDELEVNDVQEIIDVELTANVEIINNVQTSSDNEPSIITNDSDDLSTGLDSNQTVIQDSNSTPIRRVDLLKIKDISEIENLTAKQLKELLAMNRVDFKGCCEKNELLERAKRLWNDTNKSREDLDRAPTEELCKICMDAPMECVMLECGHIATCIACGKQLNECPICRQFVVRVVRFFKS